MTNKSTTLLGLLTAITLVSMSGVAFAEEGDKYVFFAKGTIEIPAGTTMNNGTINVTETQSPATFHVVIKEKADGLYDVIRAALKTLVYLDTQTEPIEKQIFFPANQTTFSITDGILAFDGTSTVNKVAKAERIMGLIGNYTDNNSNGRQGYSILGDIEVADTHRDVNMSGSFILQDMAIKHRENVTP